MRLGRAKLNCIRKQSLQGYESNGRNADGVRVENVPRNHNVGLLEKIQNLMTGLQCEPEHFTDMMISISVYAQQCECNAQAITNYVRKSPRGHWSFLGLAQDKRYGTHTYNSNGSWDQMTRR